MTDRATLLREADDALNAARRCRDGMALPISAPNDALLKRMAAYSTLALALMTRANLETMK